MLKIQLSEHEMTLTPKQLAERYELTPVTARRSLKRGYVVTNYHTNRKAASKELQAQLMTLLSLPYWNYAGFNMKDLISSVKAGRRQLSETDANNIKQQIAEVKDTITQVTDYSLFKFKLGANAPLHRLLRELMKEKRVKTILLFGGDETAIQVTDNLRKKFPLKADQVNNVIRNLNIELLEFYDLFGD